MTAEQQKLVEDNHQLIFGYAHKRNLNPDEWYDILAIGMCKAATVYDPGKGAFSTIAYYYMMEEVTHEFKRMGRQLPTESLYSPVAESFELIDTLSMPEFEIDSIEIIDIQRAIARLSDNEKTMISMLYNGAKRHHVAERFGLTVSTATRIVVGIKQKLTTTQGGDKRCLKI